MKRKKICEVSDLPVDHPSRRRLPPLLRECWMRLNYTLMRRLADLNLSPDQYIALRWLTESIEKGERGLSQKNLCELMASDPNTIAAIMRRMEKASLIQRTKDPDDGRKLVVSPTPQGVLLYAKASVRAKALEKEALNGLSPEDKAIFLDGLNRLANSCRQTYQDLNSRRERSVPKLLS
ncbi:MAG: MarR family transcriptional regulator [Verrucomicrobia bacterium]|nr:MarR family transcriptional regulator [Verrucomicrobiota bacterium]MDA0722841.1 MarR family transcriptional regulator [Verrucomicrobiota bacterium]MDA1045655.1 MarR family transcriptional regulator [Verrucomicrobiota bacterium]